MSKLPEKLGADPRGDRDNLDLLGNQDDLVSNSCCRKPTAVFLIHGRQIPSTTSPPTSTVLDGWYRTRNRNRRLDVLFGDYNPGGKLPIKSAHGRPKPTTIVSLQQSVNTCTTTQRTSLADQVIHFQARQSAPRSRRYGPQGRPGFRRHRQCRQNHGDEVAQLYIR
jgi:hypothetical protein